MIQVYDSLKKYSYITTVCSLGRVIALNEVAKSHGAIMQDNRQGPNMNFTSFNQFESSSPARGMNDWAVPWADLMMVMFVLFVVLFIYASTHQDVKILFSQQSADEARSTSTLDPLIGLIGQLSSRADVSGNGDVVQVGDKDVLYRSRADGVTVVRENGDQIRITLRGALFFQPGSAALNPDAGQYIREIAEIVQLRIGTVHVIGFSSDDEATGKGAFTLSTDRAAEVADLLMTRFDVSEKRIVITGRGPYQPELPETSATNNSLNRRVEIVITNAK